MDEQELATRSAIKRHVVLSIDQMVEEASKKFGPVTLDMDLQAEIHVHIAMLLLHRTLLRRFGFVPSLLKDSL